MSDNIGELCGYSLRIDPSQCIGCAVCADVCPSAALVMGLDEMLPRWIASRCHGCTICARQCPTGAIVGTRRRKRSVVQK